MKRLLIVLTIGVLAVVGFSGLPGDTSAGAPVWPSLSETCHDTNGDGIVDLPNDILSVIQRFGTVYGGPPNPGSGLEYALLYDVKGPNAAGGTIDLPNDILGVIQAFNTTCNLIDTQVVAATAAVLKYQDCQDAMDDGYVQTTDLTPNMGIHISKDTNLVDYPDFYSGDLSNPNDQMRHPIGLVCTDGDTGPDDVPDQLIGVWYVMPNLEACPFYNNPPNCSNTEPIAFGLTNTDEDNTDHSGQNAWHDHPGLCVWGIGTLQAGVTQGLNSQAACDSAGSPNCPCYWYDNFAWMVHLYNFIPHPLGRFLMWNSNVPFVN